MIHMKSLIRRLDCVSWLLTAGLVLGWVGVQEAVAQDITLKIDTYEVSEAAGGTDGKSVDIKVTASVAADAANDIRIGLDFVSEENTNPVDQPTAGLLDGTTTTQTGLGTRFRFEGMTDPIVITKGTKSGEAVIKFFPVNDAIYDVLEYDADSPSTTLGGDYYIRIVSSYVQGGGAATGNTTFRLVDDDKDATRLIFSPDMTSISNESDELTVQVTAYLNGKNPLGKDLEIAFRDVSVEDLADSDGGQGGFDTFLPGEKGMKFNRDDEDTAGAVEDSLAERDVDYTEISGFGTTTLGKDKTSIVINVVLDPNSFANAEHYPRYLMLGTLTNLINPNDVDDTEDDTTLEVRPAIIEIIDSAKHKVKSVTEVSTPIYENQGEQKLLVKVELEAKATAATGIDVRVVQIDNHGERDRDYDIEVAPLTIESGGTSGIAEITVIPNPNSKSNDWQFKVTARVGNEEPREATVKIVDAETDISEIRLRTDPNPYQIKEIDGLGVDGGGIDVTITAFVIGKASAADISIPLTVVGGDAIREVDYAASLRTLTISKGDLTGSQTITIFPVADNKHDGDGAAKNESILVGSPTAKADTEGIIKIGDKDIEVKRATITLVDTATPAAPPPEAPSLTFEDTDVSITGTVDEELEKVLPVATGDDDVTYLVRGLPDGLMFDGAERTISGTPTKAGQTEIEYFAIGADNLSAKLSIAIDIAEKPVPQVLVKDIKVAPDLLRENAGHATTVTVTVTLAKAAAADEKITLAFVAPNEGGTATRDEDFVAMWAEGMGPVITIPKDSSTGMAQFAVTPIQNTTKGDKAFGVQATTETDPDGAKDDITIADDESSSSAILLSVDPAAVTEKGGPVSVAVTANLSGGKLDKDATVTVGISNESTATRDEDYTAGFETGATQITIASGETSGTTSVTITPIADEKEEVGEVIVLTATADDLATGSAVIALMDGGMDDGDMDDGDMDDGDMDDGGMDDGDMDDGDMDDGDMDDGDMDDGDMMAGLHFAEEVADQAYTAGTAITALVLPEAMGGEGEVMYQIFGLPAGLSFDAETRTISGTPEAAAEADILYLATDSVEEDEALEFSITVNPALSFGDSLGDAAAGKANPASEHGDADLEVIVGQELNLPLPEVSGGTPPLTYSVAGLPAGLSFDAETRTVSGTPEAVTDGAVEVTYIVTDANGQSVGLPILVAVIPPPLDAPDNLVAEDYMGADGQGDQGGFVLLSWELSENHDSIDGYRIFRALPVLSNEMVPWAMVDPVPGVESGRAIVATLDNVSTRWGIAAERSGQTTLSTAKAVFVSAEDLNQPYALMAETLMASREAAQAGDAPVFASLLPEAFAYAQGVTPRLNVVEGVLSHSSEITVTDEPVRAIDNIAPLAVPSLSVLDAPNDAGSRILLTWAQSPSDQLLQGVVEEAIGPTELEPVIGVYGYSIYRKTGAEGEFAMTAQVDAGVTSFVDETALNGVRYTYQVRPYDLDNETGSDIEQTAMAVRNSVLDSEGRAIFGLFGADNRIGFDDFFIFADNFGLTAEDPGFDPAFDLAPSTTIDFDDFFVFADNFGRSTAAAGKRVPMLAGLNADARMYLDARTGMPSVGEDFILDVRLADFIAVKGYGLQVQYDASQLEFVQVMTDQPLGGSEFATPQVLADQAGVLTVAAHGDIVSEGEVMLSLVFRPTTEIEDTVIEITDNQTYDSEFGFNRLALPAPVQLQTRPEAFALANNYPNPFNPATTIKYALPQAADVELTVYNVLGQPIRTLVAEHQSAGRYVVEWDATNDSGHRLSSGMYFYRLQAGGEFLEVKKMLLLK